MFCITVLHRPSSLHLKRIGLSVCGIDKACTNKDADLITATVLAAAEQIRAAAHGLVNNTARSRDSRKPVTDNKVALSARKGGLSLSHLSLIHFSPP